MAAVALTNADLAPFATIDDAKADAMIADALALAARVAPCITEETFEHEAAAKAIIRGAILRWHEAGTGAMTHEGIGSYQYTIDNRQQRKSMFWPSEITDLQALCQEAGGAFAVDTVGTSIVHADSCALNFGANYCSCGADIAYYPLYG